MRTGPKRVNALESLGPLIGQVLRLETSAIGPLTQLAGGGQLALLVVVLAGLSEALGESLVLFVNRVPFKRFLVSVVISAVIFVCTYGFLTLSIFAVARLAFGATASVGAVARVVGCAYAPMIFSFVTFIPFFGQPLGTILHLWSLVAVLLGVETVFTLSPPQSLACVTLGGLVLFTVQRTVGRPLTALARWLRRRAAGTPLTTGRKKMQALIDAGPDAGLPSPPDRSGAPDWSGKR